MHKPAHRWTGRPGMMEPRARLDDMDLKGIEVAILFGVALSSAAIGLVENPARALATCHAYNDWLAEYCRAAPDQLKGVAAVPFQEPEAGARELRRPVRELGLVAVRIPTWPDGRDPGARRFDPIYAAAEELGVAACVTCSPPAPSAPIALTTSPQARALRANVFMAFAGMIAGGVLERFPGLRIGVFEAGCGWIPYLVERFHEPWELFPDQLPHLTRDPAELMASDRCFYTIEPEETTVPFVAERVGDGRLMYASDYAHFDCMCPDSVSTVAGRADLGPDLKRKLLGDNAAKLFNLEV